jgi:ABC-type transport system substrate-binding protein
MSRSIFASLACAASAAAAAAAAAAPPTVTLRNAADPGVVMPWSGAGSGGYTGTAVAYGACECCAFAIRAALPPPFVSF